MDLRKFQQRARETDQLPPGQVADDVQQYMVPLLGLAGEAGSLLTEFKKAVRDEGYHVNAEFVEEELGDILWYVANIADRLGLNLNAIATNNLNKAHERFSVADRTRTELYDSDFPHEEQLPREMSVLIQETYVGAKPEVHLTINGEAFGNRLSDNAHLEDGYRFHDAFHFAHVAVLGWSPVLRALLQRKRRSNPGVDEVEDGGRAIVIEETIVALVECVAQTADYFSSTSALDYHLLALITRLVSPFEVSSASTGEWEEAIKLGCSTFVRLRENRGGEFRVSLKDRSIEFIGVPGGTQGSGPAANMAGNLQTEAKSRVSGRKRKRSRRRMAR